MMCVKDKTGECQWIGKYQPYKDAEHIAENVIEKVLKDIPKGTMDSDCDECIELNKFYAHSIVSNLKDNSLRITLW